MPQNPLTGSKANALSGHLHEPPRPARTRPQHGKPSPARTRAPSLSYSLRPEEWSFLRTWDAPAGFPAMESPMPLLRLCQTTLLHTAPPSAASTALQNLQLREAIAAPLAEIHRLGLSGIYGLPSDLTGAYLAAALAERLPALIASL